MMNGAEMTTQNQTTAQRSTSAAMTRLPPRPDSAALAVFNRSLQEQKSVTEVLQLAADECHLVSPATSCGELPEGTAVCFSTVLLDVERDTYAVGGGDDDGGGGGKRGLSKHALDKIAMASGVSWDPHLSRRTDDGRTPGYCAWVAVGSYRDFSGTTVTIQGSKEVDLRPGSPVVEALLERYRTKLAKWERGGKRNYEPKDPTGMLREQRLHIMSLCETKARLRAIRSLGIRTAYTPAELARPFVVARLHFNGVTDDPELRREFALMNARAMLAGSRALYGDPRPPMALLPGVPAPPVGTTLDTIVDEPELEPEPEGPVEEPAATGEPLRPETASADGPPSAPAARTAPERTGFVIPGGNAKGTPLEDASDGDLQYWADRLEKALADGSTRPQYRERDEALACAMRDEQARRR